MEIGDWDGRREAGGERGGQEWRSGGWMEDCKCRRRRCDDGWASTHPAAVAPELGKQTPTPVSPTPPVGRQGQAVACQPGKRRLRGSGAGGEPGGCEVLAARGVELKTPTAPTACTGPAPVVIPR